MEDNKVLYNDYYQIQQNNKDFWKQLKDCTVVTLSIYHTL